MENRIKYICHYETPLSKHKHVITEAGVKKMNYVIDALQRAGFGVDVISVAKSSESRLFTPKESIVVDNNLSVRFFSSFRRGGWFYKSINTIWSYLNFMLFILTLQKGETVLVYHSLGFYNLLIIAKRLKKIRLIMEVEEVYQDVMPLPRIETMWEYKSIGSADGYIFPTELLDEKINKQHKPSMVIYGTYLIERRIANKFNDSKIHVVYSGTFNPYKGGAMAAIESARFLPDNYMIHISGFGDEEMQQKIQNRIIEVNGLGKAQVIYEGCLEYDDYIRLLQQCHIGLCSQTSKGVYNDTSFPSKILTYLSNDLIVVSSPSSAVLHSEISGLIHFCDDSKEDGLAKSIMEIDVINSISGNEMLQELDKRCVKKIKTLLE